MHVLIISIIIGLQKKYIRFNKGGMRMKKEEHRPEKAGLLDFIKDSQGCQFVIPVYQRNYTWTANKEVKQYVDDLKNVLNKKYNKHFLGIIIYLDTPITFRFRELSVIDGQQRLTTTFLLLYALKDLMIEQNDIEAAGELEQNYLLNRNASDKLKFRLKPLVSDDEVYKQIVNGRFDDITEKNSNVYKNYYWLKGILKGWLKEYSFTEIMTALNSLYVVCVPIVKEDSPQKIFESINSTGAKLLSPDLIRNYILMDIDSETQEIYYKKYWERIEGYITSDAKKLELFFRMFLACKTKHLSNTTAVYQNFKIWYSYECLSNSVEDVMKEIVKYARYYYNIYLKPIDEVDATIRDSILEFRKILSDMPASFLMEICSLYETTDEEGQRLISANQFNEIITLVNIYLIRRSICGLDTSAITRLFPVLLKDVLADCDGDYTKIVDYVKKNLINKQRGKAALMPDDEMMRSYLASANVYNLRIWLKIIFEKIETFNNPAPVNLKKLSIEHLMPQMPTKEWLDVLQIDEVTYEKNLHRLGNLTLATKVDNSKMKNKPWEYKKAILADTAHLTINQEILAKDKWTLDEINERNDMLIEQIIKLYPYSSASDDVIVKHEIMLDSSGVMAMATLFEEDGSVEVQAGSEIVKYGDSIDNSDVQYEIYEIYNELLEDGIIKENDKGAVFMKPYLFVAQKKNATALSVSAGVILCGSRNGWEYWKDNSGKPLSLDKELRARLTDKK